MAYARSPSAIVSSNTECASTEEEAGQCKDMNKNSSEACMIKSFRSPRLQDFWQRGDVESIPTDWVKKIEYVLDMIDAAVEPEDLNLPGLNFHVVIEERAARYAVMISQSWRLSFSWISKNAENVDLENRD